MVNQHKKNQVYLSLAKEWSSLSRAKRRKVGCLVVRDNQIISDGYNGTPSGFPNACEGKDGLTLPSVLHAESNAISKLARSTQSSEGSVLYTTLAPCFDCAKLIIQAGIKKVFYLDSYENTDGVDLLFLANIKVLRILPDPPE